ncbi:TetR/AcrR family transcriptional regulator [Kaistia nematophila]|uniref:TetR/AcrR family transcriptional regulator n=1 Tax=Kaistia nematophila TaxID=2994654 RepID=A0A9X3ILT2_9HYPH|nr:TetR/AcrR family transcriptional regulator [Kaistia nematophila]MBN9024614.1 TetR/AcrR family transcriptional regulator [Hyphomicrobiales bacterium]MCX5571009.1 TetR/AcrR family transcriptional regulator [Kaistia nematophila]
MARRSDHAPEELKHLALEAARAIVVEEGLRGLTVRRVAERIGYAPGTIYNLFANLDDLIVQVNAATLDALALVLVEAARAEPALRPERLVDAYFDFVESRPRLWSLLFEHRLPEGEDLPDWYRPKLAALISLVAEALGPLMPDTSAAARQAATVTMWAGLHGISTLAVSSKLALVAETEPRALGHLLVRRMLGGPAADATG